jgi:hypothetical protein
MSTIKITQLPLITQLNANTSNTVFVAVDAQSGITGKFTGTTLAAGLYTNNVLNVGNSAIILPNVIAQFALRGESYVQTNFTNLSDGGTADHVITANTGTDSTYFVDLGFANKNYVPGSEFNNIGTAIEPMSGYLYVQGNTSGAVGGNLIVGTTSTNTETRFIAGGGTSANVIAKVTLAGLKLVNGKTLTFDDGTVQNTAAATIAYTSAAYAQANTNAANIAYIMGVNTWQNTIDGFQNTTSIAINSYAQSAFSLANTNSNTIVYQTGVDVTQNTVSVAINSYAQSAFALANTTSNTVAYLTGVDVTQNTNIQSAWTKANNALANTSGTFAGNLKITGAVTADTGNIGNLAISNSTIYSALTTVDMIIGQTIATANLVINRTTNITKDINITGNLVTNGTLIDFNNSTFDPNTAFIQITAANTAYPASNTNYLLQLTGKANTVSRLVVDSFGQNTYPVLVGRMGRGSSAAPAAAANNDVLMRIVGNGFTGTQFSPSSPSKIDFVAGENFSDNARGTRIEFWNTPNSSNTIQKIASFNADSVQFTGTVNPQKGFIYTPNIFPSSQTAITIDFANNSVVRAQTATGLVVTLSNFVTGKVVDAWITNTAGTNQTFTHGVSALNSTVNSTSYNIPGTSTIYAKYWSMDGTLANTFVAITK